MSNSRSRDLLALPLAAALPSAGQSPRKKTIDEYDSGNIKLSHRLPIRGMSDDDLLFLKQIGMKWARVEFGSNAPFDYLSIAYMRSLLRRANEEVG